MCLANRVRLSFKKKVLLTLRILLFVMCAFSYSLWFSTFPALLFRRIYFSHGKNLYWTEMYHTRN